METIDLHVHSCHSDGTMTPTQIVELAIKQNLVAIALTDHDTTSGIAEALKAGASVGLKVIPGIELSCKYGEKEIHILGYNLDYNNPKLLETLNQVAAERDNRNRKMCESLTLGGYPIQYEELVENYGDAIITRAHFAKLLVKKGILQSMDEAFRGCLNDKSPYFITRKYLTPEEAIHLIQRAGGIPVLAHPLLYKLSVTELGKLLNTLKEHGLRGIEALYSCNQGTDEAFVRKLAKEHKLFITGGSDFHGTNKPHIQLGRGTGHLFVPSDLLDNLL